jgi:hypothetical protein
MAGKGGGKTGWESCSLPVVIGFIIVGGLIATILCV